MDASSAASLSAKPAQGEYDTAAGQRQLFEKVLSISS
jgi:hypothetical protein